MLKPLLSFFFPFLFFLKRIMVIKALKQEQCIQEMGTDQLEKAAFKLGKSKTTRAVILATSSSAILLATKVGNSGPADR